VSISSYATTATHITETRRMTTCKWFVVIGYNGVHYLVKAGWV